MRAKVVVCCGARADGGDTEITRNRIHVARLPGDDYNTLTQGIYATGPSKRYGVFGRATLDISDSITFTAEALYNYRKSSQLFAPFPLDIRGSNGFRISADQAYNPFGTANGVPLANALAFSGSTFRIQRVPIEVGNRDNVQTVETWRIAAGLEGDLQLAGSWKWDAFFSWSKNSADFDAYNQINLENVYRGLHSPALCAATAGCVPLNIFGTITPQMADYMRYNAHDENGASQYDFTFNLSRDLFALPAGQVGFAAGYEYRKESAYDRPDLFAATPSAILPLVSGAQQNPTTAQSRDPTTGSYDLHEVYGEINVPLLADKPGFYSLDVDAAARYSHYSTVGGKLTTKVGVAWRPIEDILVRGTFSEGFRAPSILELYQGARQTNFQGTDPCNGGGAGLVGCAGVPTTYNQSQFNAGLIAGLVAGNQNLKPETATTWSAGVALTPGHFTFTVDWFKINVDDAIAAQTASQILTTLPALTTLKGLRLTLRMGSEGYVSVTLSRSLNQWYREPSMKCRSKPSRPAICSRQGIACALTLPAATFRTSTSTPTRIGWTRPRFRKLQTSLSIAVLSIPQAFTSLSYEASKPC